VQALNKETNQRMSGAAAAEAANRFALERYVEDHLKWYKDILANTCTTI